MVQAVVEDLQGLYAYTESDEISVLFPRSWDLLDRELEKAVSLSAGLASAALSLACGTRVHFGSRAVLEVRSRDVPFILEDGQTVARLVYERLSEKPRALYGTDLGSNYQAQGLKLSKHFKV